MSYDPPPLPDADELYDQLMGQIEPELTTSQLPLLEKKYAKETAQEKAQRAERYNQAFARYEEQLAAYWREYDRQFAQYRTVAFRSVETLEREQEVDLLDDLEAAINTVV